MIDTSTQLPSGNAPVYNPFMEQPYLKLAHYLFVNRVYSMLNVELALFEVQKQITNKTLDDLKAKNYVTWGRAVIDAITLTDDSVWEVAFPMTNTGDIFTTCDGKNMFYIRHGVVALKKAHLDAAVKCGWTLERETDTMVIMSRTPEQASAYIRTVHPDQRPNMRVYGDDYD